MSLFSFGANTNTSTGGGAFGGAGAGSSGSGGMFGGGGSGGAFGASTSTSTSPLGGSTTTTGGAFGSGAGAGAAPQQPQQVITLSGPPASREAQWLMCIPAVLASGDKGKSFEEVRYDDYLQSYAKNGRAPPPVPETPTAAAERQAQGLPPLFEPQSIEESKPGLEELPEWQVFVPVHVSSPSASASAALVGGASTVERMHIITAMPSMSGFSVEELRCYAYLKGKIQPPADVIAQAQAQQQQQQQQQPSGGFGPSASSSTLKSNGIQFGGDTNETFLSITHKPEFALHSFEELRVAYMQAGREITSNEILGVTPVPSAPSLAKAPTLLIPSTSGSFGSTGGGTFGFNATTPTFKFS